MSRPCLACRQPSWRCQCDSGPLNVDNADWRPGGWQSRAETERERGSQHLHTPIRPTGGRDSASAGREGRGSPFWSSPPTRDPRYGRRAWRRRALAVLRRDKYVCQVVPGCPVRATVADHIEPARLDMTNAEFYDVRNLRASCRDHNIARGFAARLEEDARPAQPSNVVTRDYSYRRPTDV